MILPSPKKLNHEVALGLLLLSIFLVYAALRQEYVGASDWYGYYQQSLLLQQGRISLPVELDPSTFPSIIPYGFFEQDGQVLPQYPPGLPLLLALTGLLRLEFFTLPLVGVVSCFYIYLLCRDQTDKITALLFTALWGFLPVVVFGSTTIMSDLLAALTIIAAFYHYRKGSIVVSAFILGFGFCVRPSNVLFLLPLSLLLFRDRKAITYGLWLLIPCGLYAYYNWHVYGLPWRTGYGGVGTNLHAKLFSGHLGFYLKETCVQLSPWVLLLALVGLRKFTIEKLFLLTWFLIFLVFYCFWWAGGDLWWWTRFILPGYAPLFVLSAIGFHTGHSWLAQKIIRPPLRKCIMGALTALIILTPLYYIGFGVKKRDLWRMDKGQLYYEVATHLATLTPPGSYIGSAEFGGAILLYCPTVTSFLPQKYSAVALLEKVMAEGHPALLVIEPWHNERPSTFEILQRFRGEKIKEFDIWGGITVYRLQKPDAE